MIREALAAGESPRRGSEQAPAVVGLSRDDVQKMIDDAITKIVDQRKPPHADHLGGAVISREEADGLIDKALSQRFPRTEEVGRVCTACQISKARSSFSAMQWSSVARVCLQCRPINENLRRRAKAGKVCSKCAMEKPRADFSDTQWSAGAASKCRACVDQAEVAKHMDEAVQGVWREQEQEGVLLDTVAASQERWQRLPGLLRNCFATNLVSQAVVSGEGSGGRRWCHHRHERCRAPLGHERG